MKRCIQLVIWAGILAQLTPAQQAGPNTQAVVNGVEKVRPNYVLGPGDQITIRAFEVEEISDKPYRIDSEGDLNLPILGKIRASGLSVEQLEADLAERLKTLVRNPQVSVSVVQYKSEPVFFNGYFKAPGIYNLQGRRTLLEMLTTVGGIQPNASRRIKVTRHLEMGPIPLPNAVTDPERKVSTVEISLGSLKENVNPAEDIVLQPLDTISVDKAEMIYVNGEVNKVGAVELAERDSIPVTEVIAMAGGLSKDSAPEKARVLRPVLNTAHRSEIPINLKKVLAGQDQDFPLLPNDMLYIPKNSTKLAWSKASIVALPMATALAYVLASKL